VADREKRLPQPFGFQAGIAAWLWLTVLFATFAEAVAEGRGKAHAASLRASRGDTMARFVPLLEDTTLTIQRAASELRRGDHVLVHRARFIPSDGEIIPPAELLDRMRAGRIYRPEQAERAMRGFFKEGALAALRELALRRTADRVDADVTGWMRCTAAAGPWPVGDRVLALVPAGRAAEAALHQARRIAEALRAPLLALHVEQPGEIADAGPGLALAEQLGADTEVTTANDLPAAVLAHARARTATHFVVGLGHPPWWRRWLGRTLIAALA